MLSTEMLKNVLRGLLRHEASVHVHPGDERGHSADIDALLRKGYAHQDEGDWAQAEDAYQKILSHSPLHADALFLLGQVNAARGNDEEAISLIQRAIGANPTIPDFHAELGRIYLRQNTLAAAERSLRQAFLLGGSDTQLLTELGTTLLLQSHRSEALDFFRLALNNSPEQFEALYNTGITHWQSGHAADARPFIEKALQVNPSYFPGHLVLAEIYLALNLRPQALRVYASTLIPGNIPLGTPEQQASAYHHHGDLLTETGDLDSAIGQYHRAVELNPSAYGTWLNLGNTYKANQAYNEAIQCFLETVTLNPGCAVAYSNLALVLHDTGDCLQAKSIYDTVSRLGTYHWPQIPDNTAMFAFVVAIALIDRALELAPDTGFIHLNKGTLLEDVGRHEDALVCHERAIAFDPTSADAHFNKGITLLRNGDFAAGLEEYEWRLSRTAASLRFEHLRKAPLWDGRILTDEVLLIHAEQGLGDTIQFIRYYKDVAARCRHVIIEVQLELAELVAQLVGASNVYTPGSPLPAIDYQVPLLSLPRIFETRLESVPATVPYLWPSIEKIDQWRELVHAFPGLRVGLVWAGITHGIKKLRACSFVEYAPLASREGVTFFSLQKGESVAELRDSPSGINIISVADRLETFHDTAGLIANLDLIISVDTSVAHMAGAMGKDAWVLIPFNPDWRWLLGRNDSPWYPTMRLFRQNQLGNWHDCIHEISLALTAKLKGTH